MHNVNGAAPWHKVIWFSQNIPKQAFVLWLAVQNRLMTQDRIKSWGSYDMMVCSLCHNDCDSHNHLFFKCEYAMKFWVKVKDKLVLRCEASNWNEIVSFLVIIMVTTLAVLFKDLDWLLVFI